MSDVTPEQWVFTERYFLTLRTVEEKAMADYSSNALSHYTEDSLSTLFEPDVVLPSQFMVPDEKGLAGGERRLMAAILSDGIEAYIAQCTSATFERRRGKVDACEWVDTVDYSYVFSFDNVCECLGINPEYLRIGLTRYVEAVREKRARGTAPKVVWRKIRRPRKQ